MRQAPSIAFGSRRWTLPLPSWPGAAIAGAVATGSLALTTAAVAIREGPAIGIEDASPVYLVAVVAVAAIAETIPAVLTIVVGEKSRDGAYLVAIRRALRVTRTNSVKWRHGRMWLASPA